MSSCLPICEVKFLTAADSDKGALNFRSFGSGSTRQQVATALLGLQSAIGAAENTGAAAAGNPFQYTPVSYISPVFYLLAEMFARWKVNRLMFHYTPQSSTTVNGRAVFAFADDPVHPVLNPDMSTDISGPAGPDDIPTTTSLLSLGDTMAFAPWLPWTLDVSKTVGQNELYTDAAVGWTASDANYSVTNTEVLGFPAAMRQWALGSLSCATLTTEASSFDGGVLWMEIDVSLIEFCPITTFATNSAIGPGPLPSLAFGLKLKSISSSKERGEKDTAAISAERVASKKANSHEVEGLNRLYSLIGEVMQRQCKLQDRFEDMLPLEEATKEDREIPKGTRKVYQGLKFHDDPDITVTAVNPEKVELSGDPNRSCLQMAEGSDLEDSVRKWRTRQEALRVIFDDPTYELPKSGSLEQGRE
jgi:hypothetical protein